MKRIDFSLIVEIIGVALVTTGLALFSPPIALIALGSFLVWATEKAN
jgi:biopolymer transport protein ExbB/TolQ